MMKAIKESKILVKYISCEDKYNFDDKKFDSKHKQDNDKCQCECKKPIKHRVCDEDCVWNPGTCVTRTLKKVNM